jgi:hypothetical protein
LIDGALLKVMTSTTNLSDRCYIEMKSLEKATRSSEAGFSPHTLSCIALSASTPPEKGGTSLELSVLVHQYDKTYFRPIWSAAACCRFHRAKLASQASSAQQASPEPKRKLAHSKYVTGFH